MYVTVSLKIELDASASLNEGATQIFANWLGAQDGPRFQG